MRGRLDHPIDYAENPEKTANPKYTEADLQAMVDVMEYATNKNKTEQRFFVTGVNCDPTTARDEMMIMQAVGIQMGGNDDLKSVAPHSLGKFNAHFVSLLWRNLTVLEALEARKWHEFQIDIRKRYLLPRRSS